ncbi:unnamed protein product [Diabrotica balteata]|uniref:Reverse transcriptase domain-containing protein n=1 Tax=Diabrotica balteata TaxID=107213 RepID=A0A9N9XB47_DIABA|nr:unnamed protein product [Diabrotica balteata]
MIKYINWANKGINVNGRKLSHLRYADNIVIFATSFEDELGKNKKKMTNLPNIREIKLNDINLQSVSKYIYLGQIMKVNKENQTATITRRIRLAWARFRKVNQDMRNMEIRAWRRKAMDRDDWKKFLGRLGPTQGCKAKNDDNDVSSLYSRVVYRRGHSPSLIWIK